MAHPDNVSVTDSGVKRVLACRPKRQNVAWARQLQQAGFVTIDCPLMTINPLLVSSAQQAITNLVVALDRFEHVIFVSQNAVDFGFEWFERYWPQLPVNIVFYAVGVKTAERIRAHCEKGFDGFVPNIVTAKAGMDSEDLLNSPGLNDVQDQHVLLCKGVGGKDLIEKTLRARGAKIEICSLYERKLSQTAERELATVRLDKNTDIFPVFSGESLEYLNKILCQHEYSTQASFIPLVVPGKRVAALAKGLGYHNIATAKNATEVAMLECIQSQFAK